MCIKINKKNRPIKAKDARTEVFRSIFIELAQKALIAAVPDERPAPVTTEIPGPDTGV